jgi:hypothetical protein
MRAQRRVQCDRFDDGLLRRVRGNRPALLQRQYLHGWQLDLRERQVR